MPTIDFVSIAASIRAKAKSLVTTKALAADSEFLARVITALVGLQKLYLDVKVNPVSPTTLADLEAEIVNVEAILKANAAIEAAATMPDVPANANATATVDPKNAS